MFFIVNLTKQFLNKKGNRSMELKKRVKSFLDDTGATVIAFCKRINISNTYYYRWINGEVEFSEDICNRIETFLNEVYAK